MSKSCIAKMKAKKRSSFDCEYPQAKNEHNVFFWRLPKLLLYIYTHQRSVIASSVCSLGTWHGPPEKSRAICLTNDGNDRNPTYLLYLTTYKDYLQTENKLEMLQPAWTIQQRGVTIQPSWCFFPPIWKICSSNWIISPGFGVKIQKYLKHFETTTQQLCNML